MARIITRFLIEPNKNLELGHLKSLSLNFEYHKSCHCILRFDDSDPETSRLEYVNDIVDDINLLKFKPSRITYTSDYFDKLIDYAKMLIEKDLAYVDLTEIGLNDNIPSICRDYDSAWHYVQFNKMINGFYKENDAILRLKISTLCDPIIYKVKYTPHYRTDTKYVVYPTFDFSHGIIDSIEGITHLYCNKSYSKNDLCYWLLKNLKLIDRIVYKNVC